MQIAYLLVGGGKFVSQRLALIFRRPWRVESLIKPFYRKLWHALLDETMSQEVTTLQIPRRAIIRSHQAGSCLELFQGFFEQVHFLVSQSQIVVCFIVAVAVVFGLSRYSVLFENLGQTSVDTLGRLLLGSRNLLGVCCWSVRHRRRTLACCEFKLMA